MSRKRTPTSAAPSAAADPLQPDPDRRGAVKDSLRPLGGSDDSSFHNELVNAVVTTAWLPKGDSVEGRDQSILSAMSALMALEPVDEIKGIVGAQAVTLHDASMKRSRRAMNLDRVLEAGREYRGAAANTSCA